MSLYREPGRRSRTKAIVAGLATVAVLAAGYGIGRATAPEPTLSAQLADLRGDAAPAADALELIPLNYGSADAATRAAARTQLARAEQVFADVEDRLALVNPTGTAAALKAIATLGDLVAAGAPADDVEDAAAEAERAVRAAAA